MGAMGATGSAHDLRSREEHVSGPDLVRVAGATLPDLESIAILVRAVGKVEAEACGQ